MRSWSRAAAVFYMVAGIAFIYLGIRGPRTDALRIALGVVFIVLSVFRYRRARAVPPGATTPPGGPPRA